MLNKILTHKVYDLVGTTNQEKNAVVLGKILNDLNIIKDKIIGVLHLDKLFTETELNTVEIPLGKEKLNDFIFYQNNNNHLIDVEICLGTGLCLRKSSLTDKTHSHFKPFPIRGRRLSKIVRILL